MTETNKIFSIHSHFLRSTNLERDWHDPSALESYIYTLHAQESLARIATGLRKSPTMRAWRITGDYGSGKSSFALLLANVLAKRTKSIPSNLKKQISESVPEVNRQGQHQLIPIVITGVREPLGSAILKRLLLFLKEFSIHANFYSRLEQILDSRQAITDEDVLDWLRRSQAIFIKNGKGDGIVLILDEAGKFLEYASMQPDQQDIYLLQLLAEFASRSGNNPFFIISIFHQGISTYAESLSKPQQREWEKVSGRFEEIVWHFPVEQSATLAASALNTQLQKVEKSSLKILKRDMQSALKLGWYGLAVNQTTLTTLAERLYPIHPTVFPILVKLFSTFGQNERSLYSFLLGTEPFGLQEFVIKTNGKQLFCLNNLYDYAKNTFGSKLGTLSYHWKAIDNTVNSFVSDSSLELEILKTIGIINLINSDDLVASEDIILLSVSGAARWEIEVLKNKHVIHYRGRDGGYCVWPHTSVNLEEAYANAKKALGPIKDLKSLIRERIESRPIVARRHYIETGNLRYFEIRYTNIEDLSNSLGISFNADGLIIVPLCETERDTLTAKKFAKSVDSGKFNNVLIVIPSQLQYLSSFLQEVRKWEWIERSIGELRQDKFAREEVSRQLTVSRYELEKNLQSAIGLLNVDEDTSLQWYHEGKLVSGLKKGRDVMSLLTEVFDNCFPLAPRIHNELINRRVPSAAAAGARLRLCEKLFESSDEPYLGMDPEKHPPEMSMYLSVLQEARLHIKNEDTGLWSVNLPDDDYDEAHCKILPSIRRIHEVLKSQPDKRISVLRIYQELSLPPYGVRDGLTPLLLAVFAEMHEQELAFYEDGSFIPRISGSNFQRLIKAPETFELQYYPISTVRNSLFHQLIHELELTTNEGHQSQILDVVKPLLIFMNSLPEYVLKTGQISGQAQSVRSVLLKSTDPIQLIFYDLPKACGEKPISEKSDTADKGIETFVRKLKSVVDELRGAYPLLLSRIEKAFLKEFNLDESLEKQRSILAQRAQAIAGFITEIKLKSFSLRIADTALSQDAWLESLGNLLCSMPPNKWKDADVYKFEQEIHNLSRQFLRVEATLYLKSGGLGEGETVRIALTRPTGEERDQVIHLTLDQTQKLPQLENELRTLLQKHGQLGMAAASGVLWQMMDQQEN
jgi:hypothetical protein